MFVFLAWVASASALTVVPEVTLNMGTLTPDQKAELFDLESRLTTYMGDFDWDPEETRLTLRIPVALQVRTAVEVGPNVEYTALFAGGNKGDISFDENAWRFRIPGGDFVHDENTFDSFLSMIDFHVRWVIAAEYDKLAEFGGNAQFEIARRIGAQAMFSEMQDGWAKRNERLEQALDPRNQDMRTLRWLTHMAYWLRTAQKSDYEAWRSMRLALDLAESLDNPTQLAPFFKVNHRSITEILITAKDMDGLQLLMRLDSLDPTRTQFYQDAMLRAVE